MNVPPLPEFPSTLAKLDNLLITVTGFDHATLLSLAAIAVFVFVLPCQIDEYVGQHFVCNVCTPRCTDCANTLYLRSQVHPAAQRHVGRPLRRARAGPRPAHQPPRQGRQEGSLRPPTVS